MFLVNFMLGNKMAGRGSSYLPAIFILYLHII